MTLNNDDEFLVNQNGTTSTVTTSNLMSINVNDRLLVNQSGVTHTVDWGTLKNEIGPSGSQIITPQIIAPQDGAGIGGDVTYTPKTSAITSIGNNGDEKVLTFANSNSYNADTGADMGQPISETFTAGQTVTGVKAGADNAIGTVLSDASGNTMSIEPVIGLGWQAASSPTTEYWADIAYGEGVFVAVSYYASEVMYSTDGISWTSASCPSGNWEAVTYGDGTFAAVRNGTGNNTMYSDDGINWTNGSQAADGFSAVTYGDDKFVAVGSTGSYKTAYSVDKGRSWILSGLPDGNWEGVAYGDGLFVAVSSTGADNVATSTNGSSWTARSAPTGYWRTVTYGNDRFVALSSNGESMYSLDGISSWTQVSLVGTDQYNSIAYGAGLFVAVNQGEGDQVAYTSDGISWSYGSSAEQAAWSGITYGEGEFVAVANDGVNQVMYSPVVGSFVDGMEIINSTQATKGGPSASTLEMVGSIPAASGTITTWGNAVWQVSTDSAFSSPVTGIQPIVNASTTQTLPAGTIALTAETAYWARLKYESIDPTLSSTMSPPVHFKTAKVPDGWVLASAAENNYWYGAVYGNNRWVAVSSDGTNQVMYSDDDALTWQSASAANANPWSAICFGGGKFVALSRTGTNNSMHSTDGINWTASAAPAGNWASLTYSNGKYVAVSATGSAKVMSSADGISWTAGTAAGTNGWYGIAYGAGKFVAVTSDFSDGTNQVMYSTDDGATWTATVATAQDSWQSVSYGDNKFVAVSGTGQVMYSANGISWTAATAAEANNWEDVTYGGGLFVAVSGDGTNRIMNSPDGITWQSASAPEANYWYRVNYGNGKFVSLAITGTNRVMWSFTGQSASLNNYYDTNTQKAITGDAVINTYGIDLTTANIQRLGFAELIEQPTYPVAGYQAVGNKYQPIEDLTFKNDILKKIITRTAVAVAGYYPLFTTEEFANAVGNGSSHAHVFDGVTYYMPDSGIDIYHGTY